jgi:hypothetical protein
MLLSARWEVRQGSIFPFFRCVGVRGSIGHAPPPLRDGHSCRPRPRDRWGRCERIKCDMRQRVSSFEHCVRHAEGCRVVGFISMKNYGRGTEDENSPGRGQRESARDRTPPEQTRDATHTARSTRRPRPRRTYKSRDRTHACRRTGEGRILILRPSRPFSSPATFDRPCVMM